MDAGKLRERAQSALAILGIDGEVTVEQLLRAIGTHDAEVMQSTLASLVLIPNRLNQLVGNNQALCHQWMRSRNLAFGGQTPLDVLQEEQGVDRILVYLNTMLEHG